MRRRALRDGEEAPAVAPPVPPVPLDRVPQEPAETAAAAAAVADSPGVAVAVRPALAVA
jgi:hypothetical protein